MGVFMVMYIIQRFKGVQRLNGLLLSHRLVVSRCLAGFPACSPGPRWSCGLLGSVKWWELGQAVPSSLQQSIISCTGLGSTWDPRQAYLHLVMQWLMALLTCSVAAPWWFRLLPVITAILCTLNSSCICPSRVHLLPARSSFLAVLWLAA